MPSKIDNQQGFEVIKKINARGRECWSARDLAFMLEYQDWRNFQRVIQKAQQACKSSQHDISDHFVDITKIVYLGAGAHREQDQLNYEKQEVR